MPAENLESKQMMVEDQCYVEQRTVVWSDRRLVAFVQELPDALRKHFGDVGERSEGRVLEDLKTVVIDELSVERIRERQYRDCQNAQR